MNFSAPKKDQNTQYAIIGGILLFIVGLFISYPSLSNSAADDYASGRKSKSSVNLKSWNSVYEGLAPGQAIGAESSSDTAVSHLYVLSDSDAQMFQYDNAASSSTESGAGTAGSAGGAAGAAGGSSASNSGDGGSLASALKAKLQSMSGSGLSGLGGSGGGSSSSSAGYGKTPSLSGNTGSAGGSSASAGGKGGSMVALEKSSQLSADAATKKNEGAAAAAASAFGDFQSEGVKLGGNIETANSALINSDFVVKDVKGAELAGDVKDIKYATPEASSVSADTSSSGDSMKQQIMMMILQVAITSIMGPVFGGISSALMSGLGFPSDTAVNHMNETPKTGSV